MKYFTKQWYELCQETGFHFPLEEEKQAETLSEEYFQQLYSRNLNDWLDLQQQVALYIAKSNAVNGGYIEPKPFDVEKATHDFHNQHIYRQEHIKKVLPQNIINEIADLRVFVLDKASRNVIDSVTLFCEQNKKSVERVIEEYNKYYYEAFKSFDKDMIQNINFHDCKIINLNEKDGSLTLFLDNKGGFTNINEVVFMNYKIIKQDGLLENSWWLYDEIYKVNDKYELHVLLQNKNMDLIEFVISVEHITFNINN